MFIVNAEQLGGSTIRVFFDDGKVQHFPGKMKDFNSKAVLTKCADGSTRAYYADGTTRHFP